MLRSLTCLLSFGPRPSDSFSVGGRDDLDSFHAILAIGSILEPYHEHVKQRQNSMTRGLGVSTGLSLWPARSAPTLRRIQSLRALHAPPALLRNIGLRRGQGFKPILIDIYTCKYMLITVYHIIYIFISRNCSSRSYVTARNGSGLQELLP